MKTRSFLLLSLLTTVCACAPKVQESGELLSQYATDLLQDKDSPKRAAIVATSKANSKGSIFIIGEKEQTELLRDYLVEYEQYDNSNGNHVEDGLLDFSGENFVTVLDLYNSPYHDFFNKGNLDSLRRITFDHCLMAIDTVCSISPYDKVGIARKDPAKLIVLNSPYLSTFGMSDASAVFELLGSSVKIISTLDCMLSDLFSREKDSYRIAVLTSAEVTNPEVYLEPFRKECSKYNKAPSECFVFHADTTGNPLTALLDEYVAAGKVSPLDAVLIDDNVVDPASVVEMKDRISSIMNEEYMIYGPLLGKDFRIISAREAVASQCYNILRDNKLFRLKIALPEVSTYMTTDSWPIPYSDRYLQ